MVQSAWEWLTRVSKHASHNQKTHGRRGSASALFRRAKAGGFTFHTATRTYPAHGYAVAVPGNSLIAPAPSFTAAALVAYLDTHADALEANPALHLGGWYDAKHDEMVLDLVEVFANRDAAILAGQERDEQAIFDLANLEEIPTHGTGQREQYVGKRQGRGQGGSAVPAEVVEDDDRGGEARLGREVPGRGEGDSAWEWLSKHGQKGEPGYPHVQFEVSRAGRGEFESQIIALLDDEEIGELTWYEDEKIIFNVWVARKHRRKGLGTELLRRAREISPDLVHSEVLSDDGKAWSEVVKHGQKGEPGYRLLHPGTTAYRPSINRDIITRTLVSANPHLEEDDTYFGHEIVTAQIASTLDALGLTDENLAEFTQAEVSMLIDQVQRFLPKNPNETPPTRTEEYGTWRTPQGAVMVYDENGITITYADGTRSTTTNAGMVLNQLAVLAHPTSAWVRDSDTGIQDPLDNMPVPPPPVPPTPFTLTSDMESWFKPNGDLRRDAEKAIEAIYTLDHGGLKVRPEDISVSGDDSFLTISGKIYPSDATVFDHTTAIGNFSRYFSDSGYGVEVTHEMFTINHAYRAQDFGDKFFAQSVEAYEKAGFAKIKVHANIDVGGYVWAARGFEWDYEESHGPTERMLEDLAARVINQDSMSPKVVRYGNPQDERKVVITDPGSGSGYYVDEGGDLAGVFEDYEGLYDLVSDFDAEAEEDEDGAGPTWEVIAQEPGKTWEPLTLDIARDYMFAIYRLHYSGDGDLDDLPTPHDLAILGRNDPTARWTKDLPTPDPAAPKKSIPMWPGKHIMLDTDWYGVLDLSGGEY